jgi:hypothetical protein
MTTDTTTDTTTTDTTTTGTDAVLGVLSADDLAALRRAEDVTFYHHDGTAFIRLGLGMGMGTPRVYTPRQQLLFPDTSSARPTADRVRDIPVASGVSGYDDGGRGDMWTSRDAPNVVCFASPYVAAQRNRLWVTITDSLRRGDQLTLLWLADANYDLLRENGLHRDVLSLLVRRGGKELEFHVQEQVNYDQPGRMIRRHG